MTEAPQEKLPVTVLTGFLGSGKTTLLKRLLAHPGFADTAVIINEFGEIGLDHLLIEKGQEDVVLLDAGCLCCTVSNTLADTLADLYFRRARGDVPRFVRVVIETTGLADPAPILRLLLTDKFATAHYALDGVVTVVDALHGIGQIDAHPEALKQAAVADRLVVTKTDLTGDAAPPALLTRLAALNPGARVIAAVQGAVDPAEILGIGLYDPATRAPDVRRWLNEEGHAGHRHHGADVNRHDARMRAHCRILDRPVSWAGYAAWVEVLRRFPAENLLRLKGLIAIEGDPRPYVIQGVQHTISAPLRLPAWPDGDRRGRVVLITRDIDARDVESTFTALGAPVAV